MKILFFSDNFFPESNAPAVRTTAHCKQWVLDGHQVTVITTLPNFPNGILHQGYKNGLYQIEHIDGVKVIRVWSYISNNESSLQRIIDYLSYVPVALVAGLIQKKPDIIIATSPQFFTTIPAFFTSLIKRCKWIFEVRDLWPESIVAVGAMKPSFALNFVDWLCCFFYRNADGVIVVTNSFKSIISQRGVISNRIHIATNGIDATFVDRANTNLNVVKKYNGDPSLVIGYIGIHGVAQSLDTILYAAKRLEGYEHIKFVFVGTGTEAESLKKLSLMLSLKNIDFIGHVDRESVSSWYNKIDVAIVNIKNAEVFKTVIPSKVFEAMATHTPILISDNNEGARIVADNELGFTYKGEDDEDLSNIILTINSNKILLHKISNNFQYVNPKYERVQISKSIINFINSL